MLLPRQPSFSLGPLDQQVRRFVTPHLTSQLIYPPQCQSSCSSTINTLNSCNDVGCLCADGAATNLAQCHSCLAGVPSGTSLDKTQRQEYVFGAYHTHICSFLLA